jgi:hypothetical protein
MRCFQVLEEVKAGIPVVTREEEAYLPTPAGCSMRMLLEPAITDFIKTLPEQKVRLDDMRVEFGDGYILFKGRKMYRNLRDKQCLVHVVTAGGEGGKIRLTSNSYVAQLKGKRVPEVQRAYNAFPDDGLITFCTPEELVRINDGVDYLDVLLVMHKGASFRIQRNGALEGASPWMSIQWTGEGIFMDNRDGRFDQNGNRVYRRSAAPLVEAAVPAAAE